MPKYQWHHIIQFIFCSVNSPEGVFLVIKALFYVMILIPEVEEFHEVKEDLIGRTKWDSSKGKPL